MILLHVLITMVSLYKLNIYSHNNSEQGIKLDNGTFRIGKNPETFFAENANENGSEIFLKKNDGKYVSLNEDGTLKETEDKSKWKLTKNMRLTNKTGWSHYKLENNGKCLASRNNKELKGEQCKGEEDKEQFFNIRKLKENKVYEEIEPVNSIVDTSNNDMFKIAIQRTTKTVDRILTKITTVTTTQACPNKINESTEIEAPKTKPAPSEEPVIQIMPVPQVREKVIKEVPIPPTPVPKPVVSPSPVMPVMLMPQPILNEAFNNTIPVETKIKKPSKRKIKEKLSESTSESEENYVPRKVKRSSDSSEEKQIKSKKPKYSKNISSQDSSISQDSESLENEKKIYKKKSDKKISKEKRKNLTKSVSKPKNKSEKRKSEVKNSSDGKDEKIKSKEKDKTAKKIKKDGATKKRKDGERLKDKKVNEKGKERKAGDKTKERKDDDSGKRKRRDIEEGESEYIEKEENTEKRGGDKKRRKYDNEDPSESSSKYNSESQPKERNIKGKNTDKDGEYIGDAERPVDNKRLSDMEDLKTPVEALKEEVLSNIKNSADPSALEILGEDQKKKANPFVSSESPEKDQQILNHNLNNGKIGSNNLQNKLNPKKNDASKRDLPDFGGVQYLAYVAEELRKAQNKRDQLKEQNDKDIQPINHSPAADNGKADNKKDGDILKNLIDGISNPSKNDLNPRDDIDNTLEELKKNAKEMPGRMVESVSGMKQIQPKTEEGADKSNETNVLASYKGPLKVGHSQMNGNPDENHKQGGQNEADAQNKASPSTDQTKQLRGISRFRVVGKQVISQVVTKNGTYTKDERIQNSSIPEDALILEINEDSSNPKNPRRTLQRGNSFDNRFLNNRSNQFGNFNNQFEKRSSYKKCRPGTFEFFDKESGMTRCATFVDDPIKP